MGLLIAQSRIRNHGLTLIAGRIPVLDTQVEEVQLDIQIRQNELFFDKVPNDSETERR